MTRDKITYDCDSSKGCRGLSKIHTFTIDRVSGSVLDIVITDFDKKMNLDNMKITFTGTCSKGQHKF